ncbi:MAG: hypothetical protein C0423_18250 [Methylibium sp.]|nr:hypothetical protein [Methylibium sp.]
MSAPPESFHHIHIEPQGWEFSSTAGQSLLLAALQAGYRLPHSCRNGTCRACMTRLMEGRVEYQVEWPGLLREEKEEGWILPCVACARSDLRLDAPLAVALRSNCSGGTLAPSSSPAPVDKSVHSLQIDAPSD